MAAPVSTPKKAVLYLRISLDKTGEGLGVERQETDARKLVEARGWEVAGVINENSVSAAGRKAREGFEELLELIERGEVQVVVAWNLDRLTRNRRDSLRLIELGQKHKITIALCRGSDLDMSTPSGRMTAEILAAIARGEIETMSDRVSAAAFQAAMAGKNHGGGRPFGYQGETKGKYYSEKCEPEAEAIREAYDLVLNGTTLQAIARGFNQRGILTAYGHPWRGPVLSRTLRMPRYAGLQSYQGKLLKNDDGELIKSNAPAIVDYETWLECQRFLNDPNRRPATGNQQLLSSVARCGVCGAGIHSGGARAGKLRLRCAGRGCVHRMAAPVEAYVTRAILYRLQRADAAELFTDDDDADVAEIQAQIRKDQGIHDGLLDLHTDGKITKAEFESHRAKMQARIAQLQLQLPTRHHASRAVRSIAGAADVEAAWVQLHTSARRDIIDALATVTLWPPGPGVTAVKPEHVVVEWKTG
jgi:DNA invertase Pin-like site-specific DNA recombinase